MAPFRGNFSEFATDPARGLSLSRFRTKSDRGIVVILDNRIVTKPYGRSFMQALPKCPVEIV